MFPGEQERLLIYLLYHCGFKPREIMRYCPQGFSDVQEVYRLRCKIFDRLLQRGLSPLAARMIVIMKVRNPKAQTLIVLIVINRS